jgi:RHS repeat-associated protein
MGNVNLYGQCSPQNCAVPNDFITSYSYNFVGEPAGGSTFVSGGPYWTNAYDAIGRLQSVWTSYLTNSSSGNLISGITYNALGERTGDSLASGLPESWSYDNEGRVNGYSAGSLYNYGLTYTPLITSSTDSINSNYSYTYDGLGRLSTAGNGTNNFSYGYDRWGNRWNQTVTKGSGPPPTYYFNANNQSGSFTYDAAGNITNDGSHTYSYDAEGRVLKVDGGTTNTYVYNSRGMRAALAGAENLFDLNGNIVSVVTPGTATLAYNRYTVGGRLLAANLSGTTDFYHQDWLGGIRAGSSLSGSLIDSCTNLPFGDGTNNCGLWYFAGLMSDPWDTLNTSATRSQSPTSGRWLTPDPAGLAAMDLSNPQTWNRYAYVTNNPVSFTDPTGLDEDDDGGGNGDIYTGSSPGFINPGNPTSFQLWGSLPTVGGSLRNTSAANEAAWLGSDSIPWYQVGANGQISVLFWNAPQIQSDSNGNTSLTIGGWGWVQVPGAGGSSSGSDGFGFAAANNGPDPRLLNIAQQIQNCPSFSNVGNQIAQGVNSGRISVGNVPSNGVATTNGYFNPTSVIAPDALGDPSTVIHEWIHQTQSAGNPFFIFLKGANQLQALGNSLLGGASEGFLDTSAQNVANKIVSVCGVK